MTAEGRSPRPVRTRNSSNLLGLVRKHPVLYSDACSSSRSHAHAHACWLPCASQSRALHSLELFTVSSSSQSRALHSFELFPLELFTGWSASHTSRATDCCLRRDELDAHCNKPRPSYEDKERRGGAPCAEPDRWGAVLLSFVSYTTRRFRPLSRVRLERTEFEVCLFTRAFIVPNCSVRNRFLQFQLYKIHSVKSQEG